MDVPAGAALPTRAARGGQKPARAGGTAEASRRGRRVGRTPQGGAGGGQAQRPALGSPPPRVAEVLRYLIAGAAGSILLPLLLSQ